MMDAVFSVDTERDLHSNCFEGIEKGIPSLVNILNSHNIKATFFVTGEVLDAYPNLFKKLKQQGHEISLHGYSHKRYDLMSKKQKKEDLAKSLKAYKKVFKTNPKGFRAPQHSIDKETISLLAQYHFFYDSSKVPGNIMLWRHLLKKNSDKKSILKNFFSSVSPYYLSAKVIEIPRPALLLALGGFELKVYPWSINKILLNLFRILKLPLIFTIHSWDMINIKDSRTSKMCSPERFKEVLDKFLSYSTQMFNYLRMEELYEKTKNS